MKSPVDPYVMGQDKINSHDDQNVSFYLVSAYLYQTTVKILNRFFNQSGVIYHDARCNVSIRFLFNKLRLNENIFALYMTSNSHLKYRSYLEKDSKDYKTLYRSNIGKRHKNLEVREYFYFN